MEAEPKNAIAKYDQYVMSFCPVGYDIILNLYHSIDLLQDDVVCFVQMKRPVSWYQVSVSQMTSQKRIVSSRILCTETTMVLGDDQAEAENHWVDE